MLKNTAAPVFLFCSLITLRGDDQGVSGSWELQGLLHVHLLLLLTLTAAVLLLLREPTACNHAPTGTCRQLKNTGRCAAEDAPVKPFQLTIHWNSSWLPNHVVLACMKKKNCGSSWVIEFIYFIFIESTQGGFCRLFRLKELKVVTACAEFIKKIMQVTLLQERKVCFCFIEGKTLK